MFQLRVFQPRPIQMEQEVIKPYQVLKVQSLLYEKKLFFIAILEIIVSVPDVLWFWEAGKQRQGMNEIHQAHA